MFIEGILSISGQAGLFKQVSKGANSIIVESLITGKRMPAFATSRISTLEDVALYTTDEEKPLVEVFISLFNYSEGKETVTKSASKDELVKVFETILPNYDRDKVYVSDIKKVISWYNLLVEKGIITEESVKQTLEEIEKLDEEAHNEDKDKE